MIEKGGNHFQTVTISLFHFGVFGIRKTNITFVGLNPSTADHQQDDRTIRRCINLLKSWGGGGIYMANLFAYRATDPQEMSPKKTLLVLITMPT